MAGNSINNNHNVTDLGYFTFEIAWEVANKGTWFTFVLKCSARNTLMQISLYLLFDLESRKSVVMHFYNRLARLCMFG